MITERDSEPSILGHDAGARPGPEPPPADNETIGCGMGGPGPGARNHRDWHAVTLRSDSAITVAADALTVAGTVRPVCRRPTVVQPGRR